MGSPFPLYSGTTLVFLHDCGAYYLIATSLKNSARPSTPAQPMCFNNCSGKQLKPDDLLALKYYSNVQFNSEASMADMEASYNYSYAVAGALGLLNNFSLNFAKDNKSTSLAKHGFFLSKSQNLAGANFNIFGIWDANYNFAFLHYLRYYLKASLAAGAPFPTSFYYYLY